MEARAAGDDTGDVPGYRPVSPLAVAAAALGVASMLALVGPVFWVLPLLGIAVSWAALADVARPGAPKAGRLAALVGLALAVGFGAQAVATRVTAEWLARGRVEAAAGFWLDAIAAGRLDEARSMCDPDVAAVVDRVAESVASTPSRVRCRVRHDGSGGRVVRAVVGDHRFDVVLTADPPRRPGAPERFTVKRCADVTPSGN